MSNFGKRKPYQIQRPERQAQDIDSMFEQLYRRLADLEAKIPTGNGSSGGGSTPANHDLLNGDVHPDTTAGSPTNGDIITAQAGKWARKAVGADGQLLAVAAGAPSWINPSTITGLPLTAHDLLSTAHPDTIPEPPQPGDMIAAQDAAPLDISKFFFSGRRFNTLVPTGRNPGDARYFFAGRRLVGLPKSSYIVAGNKWGRLGKGSIGDVLTVGATGPAWVAGGGGSTSRVSAYRSTDVLYTGYSSPPVAQAINFNATEYDTRSFWASVTPSRLTIPTGYGGIYLVQGAATFQIAMGTAVAQLILRVNGVDVLRGPTFGTNSTYLLNPGIVTRTLALSAGDYVEMLVDLEHGAASSFVMVGGANRTFLQLLKL